MRVVFVCTNYGSSEDGIGMYTFRIAEEIKKIRNIEVEVINSATSRLSSRGRVVSLGMVREILGFMKDNPRKKNESKIFVVEYPFMEWNPLTIIFLMVLKLYYSSSKMVLSLHEYHRVRPLRRAVIKFLIKIADGYLVTDSRIYRVLKKKKMMRIIPSNIQREDGDIVRRDNHYCFFGLINRTKAFQEMIEAWREFNKEGNYHLNIYSSSQIEGEQGAGDGIKIYNNLSDEDLSLHLQGNRYMILPIIPRVGNNNGTLKAAALHGCIPVGMLDGEVSSLGININGEKYSKENILEALGRSRELSYSEIEEELKAYSEQNSLKRCVWETVDFLKGF